ATIRDHVLRVAVDENRRVRRDRLDLGDRAVVPLSGVELENQRPTAGNVERVAQKSFAVVALERLSRVRRADEHEVLSRKGVLEVLARIVEIRNAGDDHLFEADAFGSE